MDEYLIELILHTLKNTKEIMQNEKELNFEKKQLLCDSSALIQRLEEIRSKNEQYC